MSKTLKRFLIVLIVLIGTILAIPKLEKAAQKVEVDDNTLVYGVRPVNVENRKNNGYSDQNGSGKKVVMRFKDLISRRKIICGCRNFG